MCDTRFVRQSFSVKRLACLAGAVTAAHSACAQLQFTNLGTLAGGESTIAGSNAVGVSSDGSVIAGGSSSPHGSVGCVWTATGLYPLAGMDAPVSGTPASVCLAVSGDGRVLAGRIFLNGCSVPASWTIQDNGSIGAPVPMYLNVSLPNGEASSLSHKGDVVIAYAWTDPLRSFRSSDSGPMTQITAVGAESILANDVDGTGDVVVGRASFAGDLRPFIWTPQGGLSQLPIVAGSVGTKAIAISEDGRTIVGVSGVDPVRWRVSGGGWTLQRLTMPVGAANARAERVSGDGRVITGLDGSNHVIVWVGDNAPVLLSQVLQSRSIDVGGTLLSVNGLNTDGSVLVGQLQTPTLRYRGWVIRGFPVCGTADFDGDGDAGTDADIEAFFSCLSGNCCATCSSSGSDFNADGDAGTDADIESFFQVLAGGSC